VLRPVTSNTDTLNSPRPRLGGSHHLPPYSILCGWPQSLHPNGFSLPGLPSGSLEIAPIGIFTTLEPHNFASRPWIEMHLKQSCSSHQELSNGMLHALCSQVNQVNSRLFLVKSQIGNLIPDPSFGHNLCFKCPNAK